jgi:four helix bundle protein
MSSYEFRISDLKNRTQKFAVDMIKFCSILPNRQEFIIIRGQLIRCCSSVGANYRSACRAKSRADFIAKLSIAEEEADESMYWMEILEALGMKRDSELQRLKDEANQLVGIMVASKKTARTKE